MGLEACDPRPPPATAGPGRPPQPTTATRDVAGPDAAEATQLARRA
jgi:hypothetical protein